MQQTGCVNRALSVHVVFEIILELIMQEDAEKVCGGDKFSR